MTEETNNISKKIKVKDQWFEKYCKDSIWFPFGTLVNGWATIKGDDPKYTLEQYIEDSKKLFVQAMKNVISVYKIYEKVEIEDVRRTSPDIPVQGKKT